MVEVVVEKESAVPRNSSSFPNDVAESTTGQIDQQVGNGGTKLVPG
jgi:hypothetical protein